MEEGEREREREEGREGEKDRDGTTEGGRDGERENKEWERPVRASQSNTLIKQLNEFGTASDGGGSESHAAQVLTHLHTPHSPPHPSEHNTLSRGELYAQCSVVNGPADPQSTNPNPKAYLYTCQDGSPTKSLYIHTTAAILPNSRILFMYPFRLNMTFIVPLVFLVCNRRRPLHCDLFHRTPANSNRFERRTENTQR